MKIKFWFNIILPWLMILSLLSACSSRPGAGGSSTRMRAWLDQPPDGYTLPLARFPLIAHARQPGGGVKQINFTVNGTPLGNVNTDQSVELTEATLDWNPSAPGIYRIQAISYNNAGEEAYSEIAVVCIPAEGGSGCPASVESALVTPPSGDAGMKVGASPDTLKIGANCSASSASINFEGYVEDLTNVIEVDIHGTMVNQAGDSRELLLALHESGGGGYTATYNLNSDELAFFSGGDGKIIYTLSLMNDRKEWFRQSSEHLIIIERCDSPQGGKTIKVGGSPNPAYIGKCTHGEATAIDFEAGTDVDTANFSRVDLAYVWFDGAGTWVGTTVGTETRAAMTPREGGYWFRLDLNTAPSQMDFGGSIKFRAILVNSAGTDVGFSEVSEIRIISCSVQPSIQTPTKTPTKYVPKPVQPVEPVQPVQPPVIVTTEAPPAPPPPAPPPEVKPGAVAGSVSYDSNGDGKCDAPWTFGGLSVTAGSLKAGVDGGGSFYLGPLDPGSYTVSLNHPGYNAIGSDSVGVKVSSGGTASASFCLAAPG